MTGIAIKTMFEKNYTQKLGDVQIELTLMVFKNLKLSMMIGLMAIVLGEMLGAYKTGCYYEWTLSAVLLLTLGTMITLVNAFNRQASKKLSPGTAYAWQAGIGVTAIIFSSAMAAANLRYFMLHNICGAFLSTVAVFATCIFIGGIAGLLPWVTRVSSLILFIVLGFAIADTLPPYGWEAAVFIAYVAYLQWEMEGTKFNLLLSTLRTGQRLPSTQEEDELTGLASQQQFMTSLQVACQRRGRFSILLLDLDNYKAVLDQFGAPVGDKLLQLVAARLQKLCRGSDIIARLNDDEFAILAHEPASQSASASLAERINTTLTAPFGIDNRSIQVSASIGIWIGDEGEKQPEDALRLAGDALDKAKAKDGNRLQFA
jgi:diguanylate cyclase (GGDEF)-like protein